MEIREASETDMPAIVELLRVSLGESLMPKSEAFWRWKHIVNPFGRSPVLLAFEMEQLIGVRAFMRWEWRCGEKLYKAVRAVDTATHPQHQGKGIFRKLTLQLVEQCRDEGVDFIFNTPNAISKPGYLKMGWREAGRLKMFVRPRIPVSRRTEDFETRYILNAVKIDQLPANALAEELSSIRLVTNRSAGFVKWRYADNPNVRYFMARHEKGAGLIFRLKKYSFGTEFRICEVFGAGKVTRRELRELLSSVVRDSGAILITWAGVSLPVMAPELRVGPMVTVRSLSEAGEVIISCLRPGLGDMEVF